MSGELLNGGEPIVVTTPRDRIGHGPWARLLVTAVLPNEGSSVAERGRALARGGNVHSVSVASGTISARVVGEDGRECAVTFTADPVPPRVWAAVALSARRNERLAAAMEGREQSLHLEHVMRFDWEEPLIPSIDDLCRCSCDDAACEHVAALTYVVADLIDGDPSLLLRWRGCDAVDAAETPAHSELELRCLDQSGRRPMAGWAVAGRASVATTPGWRSSDVSWPERTTRGRRRSHVRSEPRLPCTRCLH